MRLIHTGELYMEEFFEIEVPDYAILSHRWISGQEISYEDFLHNRTLDRACSVKSGWKKIAWFVQLAREVYGCQWCWVDTCCIDKKSSAELSEAINSMFKWYRKAKVCIAYLFDVDVDVHIKQLKHSQWFKRGWTLQELLAPQRCDLYAGNRTLLGDRASLSSEISTITGIHESHLSEYVSTRSSVAEKLSWVSHRETTRAEDMAYCLLGLLDVNMALLYGEGNKAFKRLQTEFIRQSDDESIFWWLFIEEDNGQAGGRLQTVTMLAPSPGAFSHRGVLLEKSFHAEHGRFLRRPPYFMTQKGLQIQIPSPMDRIKGNERFALLEIALQFFGTSRSYLLLCNIDRDVWVRLGLPWYIISHNSRMPITWFENERFETVIVRDPWNDSFQNTFFDGKGAFYLEPASKNTTGFVNISNFQTPTLADLNLILFEVPPGSARLGKLLAKSPHLGFVTASRPESCIVP